MQSVQGPVPLPVRPTPFASTETFVHGRPVHVSPPTPGNTDLGVFTLYDTEAPANSWALVAIPATGFAAPDGYEYLTSVDTQSEYRMTVHVFARRAG